MLLLLCLDVAIDYLNPQCFYFVCLDVSVEGCDDICFINFYFVVFLFRCICGRLR